jgi:hypothetical protein
MAKNGCAGAGSISGGTRRSEIVGCRVCNECGAEMDSMIGAEPQSSMITVQICNERFAGHWEIEEPPATALSLCQ